MQDGLGGPAQGLDGVIMLSNGLCGQSLSHRQK